VTTTAVAIRSTRPAAEPELVESHDTDRHPLEPGIRQLLNAIIDPCSVAAGTPAGLEDMGLVRALMISETSEGVHVDVTLAVTHPFCMMSAVFVNETRTQLSELPTVTSVEVGLDGAFLWTEEHYSPDYAARRRESLLARGITPLSDLLEETSHD
jgi:metal-sulfur cluster biosynthetic enzyme